GLERVVEAALGGGSGDGGSARRGVRAGRVGFDAAGREVVLRGGARPRRGGREERCGGRRGGACGLGRVCGLGRCDGIGRRGGLGGLCCVGGSGRPRGLGQLVGLGRGRAGGALRQDDRDGGGRDVRRQVVLAQE